MKSLESGVFLDDKFSYGGWSGPSCRACKQPILPSDRVTRVEFQNDPSGTKGLTGDYHLACSRPFASLASVINFNPWAGW
ncbi:hypothetical protein MicloDRAFT_00052950 [Microvirga lotononidis]|uniref:Uncharacterized protein n=1 Tax=Microvirga lotononidis TaxID=864069 RepID=I4YKT8_9HYPH|nr:hypothetical protein MicloDRAFT_00052950 [Microvirga lotononidis]